MSVNSYAAQQAMYLDSYSRYTSTMQAQQQAAMSHQLRQNMLASVTKCAAMSMVGMAIAYPESIVRVGSQIDPTQESLVKPCEYAPIRAKRGWLHQMLSRIF